MSQKVDKEAIATILQELEKQAHSLSNLVMVIRDRIVKLREEMGPLNLPEK